jgi:hypothetical protein
LVFALDMLAMADFTETQSEAQLAQAANAIPNYLNLVSPVYTINTTGTPPNQSNVSIALPPNSSPDDTSLYGWSSVANRWEFLPSQSADNTLLAQLDDVPALLAVFRPLRPPEPTIIVSVDITQTLTPEIANLATFVTPGGIQPEVRRQFNGEPRRRDRARKHPTQSILLCVTLLIHAQLMCKRFKPSSPIQRCRNNTSRR